MYKENGAFKENIQKNVSIELSIKLHGRVNI